MVKLDLGLLSLVILSAVKQTWENILLSFTKGKRTSNANSFLAQIMGAADLSFICSHVHEQSDFFFFFLIVDYFQQHGRHTMGSVAGTEYCKF